MKEKKNYQVYAIYRDLNKGIQSVTYNHLNLPTYITVDNSDVRGSSAYSYSARGEKMRVIHRWKSTTYNQPPIMSSVHDFFGKVDYYNSKIFLENGYVDFSGWYCFYIRDYMGNIRSAISNTRGAIYQSTEYYPFGMPYSESVGQDYQPFKYNGKELDMMNRVNLYDYGFRHYESALARFTTIDPLAEKYPWISPYAYCANNPVKFIDPDGRDIWEINNMGEIIKRMKDKTQDAFFMVAKDADGNYQRTFTTDAEGNKNYNSISFKYGTVTQSPTFKDYDKYTVSGDKNGTRLFEFLADNTKVEWGNIQYITDNSTITTSHKESSLTGNGRELLENFQLGVISVTHSHPGGTPYPSGLKERNRGDIGVAKEYESRYTAVKSYIYLPGPDKYVRETYIPYSAQSQYWDFRGHPNNHWLPKIIITAKPKKQ